MYTAVILACAIEGCRVFAGPVVDTEEQCFATVNEGAIYLQATYPELRLVDWDCVQWSEET